ncbi:MAG: DUF3817 domain-containing protein [Bacteroidia bacterium]
MIKNFCKVAVTEGWSYLILLFIAMPLKYFLHFDLAVKVIGWAHGVLFIAYMVMLLQIWIKLKWPFLKVFWAGIAAFIPFATFILEKQLKREYAL